METPDAVKLKRIRRACDTAILYRSKLSPAMILAIIDGRKA
ncbi:hypothetical protein ACTXKN_12540 [Brachybacterium alimentarium]